MTTNIVSPEKARPPLILTLDIGSSSVRAMLYDRQARWIEGMEIRQAYTLHTGLDGAVTADMTHIADRVARVMNALLEMAGPLASHIGAVGVDTLVSNVLGVDTAGQVVTPIFTYADTRPAEDVDWLREQLGDSVAAVYQRTGCPMHTAYLPGRFLWLQRTQPALFGRIACWLDIATHLYRQWFGRDDVPCSYSVAAWTGLLDRHRLTWDEGLLALLPVTANQLPSLADYDVALRGLVGTWAERWPTLRDVPFFLAVGDGAAANIGSGGTGPDRLVLTVGTTAAMRVVVPGRAPAVPPGLWAYRVDRHRSLLGGATTEGGNVFAWLRETLKLPDLATVEHELATMPPDGHGLTLLPFLGGERSPGYAAHATAAIVGLRLATQPIEILQAGLESVAYRLALIADLLDDYAANATEIIASGGALLASPTWLQIMADVLGRRVTVSAEAEATSRGVVLLALKALGAITGLDDLPASTGKTYYPDPGRHGHYRAAVERQRRLYETLIDN